jgi:hypothetical protein
MQRKNEISTFWKSIKSIEPTKINGPFVSADINHIEENGGKIIPQNGQVAYQKWIMYYELVF